MADIVGIRFRKVGKVYYFNPGDIELKVDDYVVVDTTRGMELGQVVIAPGQVLVSNVDKPLKKVLRKAEPGDINRAHELEAKEKEAMTECGRLINDMDLPMKLLSAEYSLDGKRLTFYFSAEDRIDFRKLVRELAGRLKVRVEMRQMGPRDEAKMVGGFGRCGRPLCCASFLNEFAPVSIRMAKQQGLPLNPMKISGCCGRLMCCLVYENEQYREMKGKMPKDGQTVTTAMGKAKVVETNPLKETVLVELESEAAVELSLDEITIEDKSVPAAEKKPRRS